MKWGIRSTSSADGRQFLLRVFGSLPLVLFTDQELDAHQAFDEIIRLQSPHPMPMEFNQGVVAFRRSDKVHEALRQSLVWADRLDARCDQPPLRIALFHSDVRVATLPLEYNCTFAGYGCLNGVVRILHGRIPKPSNGKSGLWPDRARTLNRITVPRVFVLGLVLAMSRKNFSAETIGGE